MTVPVPFPVGEFDRDSVAAMAEADAHHHYEISEQGVVSIMSPSKLRHPSAVRLIMQWLNRHVSNSPTRPSASRRGQRLAGSPI